MEMKMIFYLLILATVISCEQNNETGPPKNKEQNLKNFTYDDVARFTIATLMNQPTSIIKAKKDKNLYSVSYIRETDKQKFNYRVKINGNKVLWANIDGRWMNSKFDEKIIFEEDGDKLKIMIIYSDKSHDTEEFKKGE